MQERMSQCKTAGFLQERKCHSVETNRDYKSIND